MAKLYRYEFTPNCLMINHTGILVGLDDIYKDDEEKILSLSWYFEQNLKRPAEILEGTLSFFTERGNRKFAKAIRNIKKAVKEKGIDVDTIIIDDSEATILYRDKYQVLTPRPYNAKFIPIKTSHQLIYDEI